MVKRNTMSSTNRSTPRNNDYYITPRNRITSFLKEFIQYETIKDNILDPCAGGDSNNPMSYPFALRELGYYNITTLDIRTDSLADIKEDYLTYNFDKKFDVIITNPPFKLAQEVIYKSFNDVNDDGFVIMLLRLNFLGGKLRFNLWKNHLPKYIFVYNRRLSFTLDNKTDSIEYAHYVWQKNHNPQFSNLKVIE